MSKHNPIMQFISKCFPDLIQDVEIIINGKIVKRAKIDNVEQVLNMWLLSINEKKKIKELWNSNKENSLYEIMEDSEKIYFKVLESKNIQFNQQLWGDLHERQNDWDEWSDMADYDWVSYIDWKKWIYDFFIKPFVNKESNIVEIAVWHWRWTKYLLEEYKSYQWLDISNSCIDYCRNLYKNHSNCKFILWDWDSLTWISDSSVDFIFSFDSFVHIEQDIFSSYIKEFSRVLKPWWICIIHHSNIKNKNQIQSNWYRAYCDINTINKNITDNWMNINFQISKRWDNKEFSVDKFKDIITKITKKISPQK